jgi:hypothetical protein
MQAASALASRGLKRRPIPPAPASASGAGCVPTLPYLSRVWLRLRRVYALRLTLPLRFPAVLLG